MSDVSHGFSPFTPDRGQAVAGFAVAVTGILRVFTIAAM
jgi:hypothetical protein